MRWSAQYLGDEFLIAKTKVMRDGVRVVLLENDEQGQDQEGFTERGVTRSS